jgi:hypothetical protein
VLRFDYEPESDTLVATCEGDLTRDLLKDSITAQAEQGHWESALIFDAIAAKPATLSGQDISNIVAHAEMIAAGRPPRGPVVIVANDDVIYGLARMAQALSEMRLNWQVDVSRTMAQARRWLATRRRQ